MKLSVIVWLLLASSCCAMQESVPFREYIEARIEAMELARESAYEAMEKRLEGMNEFRDTLKDQASRFVTRQDIIPIIDDVRVLREKNAALEGKASQTSMLIAIGLGAVGSVIGILNLIYRRT